MTSNRHPTDIDVYIGQQIRKIACEKRITQEQIAERCGVTFQQVQKYMAAQNRLSIHRFLQIASVLQCDINTLLPEELKIELSAHVKQKGATA